MQAVVGLVKHKPIPNLEAKESILPTGLVWDPRSRGLFFNAQAGHLQLFDLERNSIIFNVCILKLVVRNLKSSLSKSPWDRKERQESSTMFLHSLVSLIMNYLLLSKS